MLNKEFDEQLCDLLTPDKMRREEPMKFHTTFRIGGAAQYYVTPVSRDEVVGVIKLCRTQKIPFYIIGNGSNLLVGDYGFRGLILEIGKNMEKITFPQENTVCAMAGVMLSKLSQEVLNQGLTGFEFASGIPGTLGGAVTMNAGAYGGEIKDAILEATVIDENNQVIILSKKELKLSYRTSIVQEKGYVVLDALFGFEKGNKEEIEARMMDLNTRRREKQPLNYPSAGSTFKRPEGFFAGKLIEDAGLRGFQVGQAAISDKHCGFVVNLGNATAEDVKNLIIQADQRVYQQFGVHLEPEVRMIGDFEGRKL